MHGSLQAAAASPVPSGDGVAIYQSLRSWHQAQSPEALEEIVATVEAALARCPQLTRVGLVGVAFRKAIDTCPPDIALFAPRQPEGPARQLLAVEAAPRAQVPAPYGCCPAWGSAPTGCGAGLDGCTHPRGGSPGVPSAATAGPGRGRAAAYAPSSAARDAAPAAAGAPAAVCLLCCRRPPNPAYPPGMPPLDPGAVMAAVQASLASMQATIARQVSEGLAARWYIDIHPPAVPEVHGHQTSRWCEAHG